MTLINPLRTIIIVYGRPLNPITSSGKPLRCSLLIFSPFSVFLFPGYRQGPFRTLLAMYLVSDISYNRS